MALGKRNEREPLWTAEDVAEFLKIHVQTVYARARSGDIPSVMVGTRRRFRPAEIVALVDAAPAATTAGA